MNRREFVQSTALAFVAGGQVRAQSGGASLTAQQLIERIRTRVGPAWRDKTVDGLKAGNETTVVKGVAVTVAATVPVLNRAIAAGHNFIVTHEPVFYSANDDPGTRAADPVYRAKKALIDDRGLVVFRLFDHWNARQPSDAAKALAEALGWSGGRAAGADEIYTIPDTTLGALGTLVRTRFAVRGGMRTVGRPDLRVRTVLLSPGTTDLPGTVARLPRADVILAGEPREWEAVPYVLDSRAAGQEKGMIAIGRVVSEEPGMRACAAWIKSFTPECAVDAFPVGDPYWTPAA
jgi:hypothetical protein